MQTTELTVCNINLFGNEVKHIWLGELSGLLENFPVLEFPHKQDFYSLIVIEEANGEIVIDNHIIRLDQLKVIIIKPRCISSININRQAKGKIMCFTEDFFSLRYNNNILYQFSFLERDAKPFIRFTSLQKSKWDTINKLFIEEYHQKKRESQKVLRSYLNILLFELERIHNPTGYSKSKNPKQVKIQDFERLIDQYFETKKLPSEYAPFLFVSPNYLNKICKEETGKTAGELIRNRIIIEAQRLLHYTNYSINEIAYKLGFESPSYFVTFFKKQTNSPPDKFRKNRIS